VNVVLDQRVKVLGPEYHIPEEDYEVILEEATGKDPLAAIPTTTRATNIMNLFITKETQEERKKRAMIRALNKKAANKKIISPFAGRSPKLVYLDKKKRISQFEETKPLVWQEIVGGRLLFDG